MTYVLNPDEVRAAEQFAVESGRSEIELMRDAGNAIAEWLNAEVHGYSDERLACGLVGPGKNGGDTLVALARLSELGWATQAFYVDRNQAGDLPATKASLDSIDVVHSLDTLQAADVILDGIFGIGGRPELSPHAVEALERARQAHEEHDVPIIAIDVPSGIDAATGATSDGSIEAAVTLSPGFFKIGLLHEPALTLAGDIVVLDLNLAPPDAQRSVRIIEEDIVRPLFPRRRASAGKHEFGGLMVIGGSPTYIGAPRLAAEAALRVGTGLVGAAVPRMLITAIAAQVPEVVFLPLSDSDPRRSVEHLNEAITGEHARYTAAVLGPGLGQDEPAKALLSRLFGQATPRTASPIGFGALSPTDGLTDPETSSLLAVPVVLDADALNWLAEEENWPALLQNVTAVLTPHPGEMARLLGVDVDDVTQNPREVARQAAISWNQVVVLKGGHTTVAAPDGRVFVAHRATPELATPGTGDVFAGIIGGLLAQGFDPVDAACAAVYLGAEAGRLESFNLTSRGVIARDVIDSIPAALDGLVGPRIWG